MNIPTNIMQCFTPIQPTVTCSADDVAYAQMAPDTRLQNLIYCYWQLKTHEKLYQPLEYQVEA
nr:AraC family transcriptional regulator [Sunxiuqinia sp.]